MELPVAALQTCPLLPEEVRSQPRFAIIGGSGVTVVGSERYSLQTPFGYVVNISFLDENKKVLFLNRHLCTHVDEETGAVGYAPPHLVNYRAMVWCLHTCSVKKVVALSSTGTLDPSSIPVGSVVMPDDFYMVKPDPTTFWPHPAMGAIEADKAKGQVGRIHFAPAIPEDEAWVSWRRSTQKMVEGVFASANQGSAPGEEKLHLAKGQSASSWPLQNDEGKISSGEDSCVYVNTIGPRFETRAEIRSYKALGGSVVGMTCAYEWTLCSELLLPYALFSVVDNACNGMSTHPGGALQEYLDHKKDIGVVTDAMVAALVRGLSELEIPPTDSS
mmetsp:Transcript_10208/g.22591  ORF Transcript_10208/g.22591 Transcript_10208/m.22591 type:complete len:331 (+) Transcript_10208:155-1147(+)|eukprot:CAMPEP_0206458156 /NCGR_PEP_ID=MMETSP0324_2-20121206/23392_1 /ASSEMBLY_ACC=CAM_ASM_000836 /TAXON_ID=2866 /ORGANISM="Crypthecodinium cohnii, Strain Seligo" /LENGTH=330 /DNA_ID=CAMNT_0053929421 /DNA_START=155 /DNA_END=1147 /DNA_ORIENTATION=+